MGVSLRKIVSVFAVLETGLQKHRSIKFEGSLGGMSISFAIVRDRYCAKRRREVEGS